MKRFWIFATVLLLAMLLLFFVVQALQLPFLAEDTAFLLGQHKWVAGLIGTGLLIIDVIAPVPSSVVMLANGILFGPLWGTLLSIAGAGVGALLGYWIGVQGERAGHRWFGDEALARAHAFFQKHGMVAVVASRPIPILAEAVSIVAGVSSMPLRRFMLATLLGLLPTALIYATAGAYSLTVNSGLYTFAGVMLLAGVVWFAGRLMTQSHCHVSAERQSEEKPASKR